MARVPHGTQVLAQVSRIAPRDSLGLAACARVVACVIACVVVAAILGACGGGDGQPRGGAESGAERGTDAARDGRRPNLLFVLTDEHRFDLVGCYGNEVIRTPVLDRLAAEGVRFDRFYVASPLCSPSRASFLSGLYPRQSGVFDNRERSDFATPVPTVASLLGEAGYRTVFIGKAHMGGDPRPWGFAEVPVLLPSGGAKIERSFLSFDGGEPQAVSGPVTRIFCDEAVRFVEEAEGDERPWLLWLSTRAAHRPYYVEEPHVYDPETIVPPPGWPPDQPISDHDWAGYYATVSFLDAEIGRVLDALDRTGAAENTFVVFAGDNGSMYGSHGEARKQVWYEECVRVPAIARFPSRIRAGSVAPFPVSSVDLLPTFLDAAGVDASEADATAVDASASGAPASDASASGASAAAAPTGLEGRSFLPALEGNGAGREVAFAEMDRAERFGGRFWRMAVGSRYKYVRFLSGEEHLFDLENDPYESRDLASDPGASAAKARLSERLDAWTRRYPDR